MPSRHENKVIAQDTLQCMTAGSYVNGRGEHVNLGTPAAAALRNSYVYTQEQSDHRREDAVTPRFNTGTEHVCENTTVLNVILNLKGKFPDSHIGVLNFASARNAGGGWDTGANAQEESIARASCLVPCLEKFEREYYNRNRASKSCAYSHTMIWSPLVPVFKTDDGTHLHEPALVSFISAPAVNAGVVRQKERSSEEKITSFMIERMDRLLYQLYINKCDIIVLGAFGCGVFKNDTKSVAGWFKQLLTNKYQGCFTRVHYAVLDPVMAGIFQTVLCSDDMDEEIAASMENKQKGNPNKDRKPRSAEKLQSKKDKAERRIGRGRGGRRGPNSKWIGVQIGSGDGQDEWPPAPPSGEGTTTTTNSKVLQYLKDPEEESEQ